MSTANNGGPAFPFAGSDGHSLNDSGMTLRDYLAAKAMQGLLANPGGPIQANPMNGWCFTNCTAEQVARVCIDMADAMLKAREVQP
jgi:hypothetical protein